MHRFLKPILFSVFILLIVPETSFAQMSQISAPPKSATVTAKVAGSYLTLCGLASPFASVIATVGDTLLRSTTADAAGKFFLSQILVNNNIQQICLSAVDFKRVGESNACINIPPITGNTTICDIFLPPTIGISQKEITQGEKSQIYGYTVPGATVTIKINDNTSLNLTADNTGYYTYTFEGKTPGTFTFQSTATFNNQDSLPPQKSVSVKVLSVPEKVTKITNQQIEKAKKIAQQLIDTGLGFALLTLILITVIIVILIKLNPRWIRFIIAKLPERRRPLHHDWLLKFIEENPMPESQSLREIETSTK